MRLKQLIVTLPALVVLVSGCTGIFSGLREEISDMLKDFPGEVGVALTFGDEFVHINAAEHFPMFSVVKFPQALAVAGISRLDQEINVAAEDLKPDTWSPMQEKYPEGGIFSVRQIIEYALIESDNNASDIMFDHFASPEQVKELMIDWDITDCNIKWSENEQHLDIRRCYDNWMSPQAAVQLLDRFYDRHNSDESQEFIWNTMAKCNTGTARIPKYIADDAFEIVHKTGTGFTHEDGTLMGINDIACIILPDGRHFELAVFIKDAKTGFSECEELIAAIARICYDRFSSK